jgi:diaminopimelate decarboxylase
VPTDHLEVSTEGELLIDGCRATDLAKAFGSPVFVISERTFRENIRRVRSAFETAWPEPVRVLVAIKANNNLALRAIAFDEGAGGECFGLGELYATFMGGADPAFVVMNGSNKTPEELRKAAELGVWINIDSEDEVVFLRSMASEVPRPVRVNIRLKVVPDGVDALTTDYDRTAPGQSMSEHLRSRKWGFSARQAIELTRSLSADPAFELGGFSAHIGRFSPAVDAYRLYAASLGRIVRDVASATSFKPGILDIGGGFASDRDPESGDLELNANSVEDYAEAVASELLGQFVAASLPVPHLWTEPGRYISANAGALLTTVGVVRREDGYVWVNIDASTNIMPWLETRHEAHVVLPASGMHRVLELQPQVVGGICTLSIFSTRNALPSVARGDLLAILDAGSYAETTSSQFNGVPRPATVLVLDGQAELIRERETIGDVFAKQRIPERLRASRRILGT